LSGALSIQSGDSELFLSSILTIVGLAGIVFFSSYRPTPVCHPELDSGSI
jgi:hypothetical protein